MKPIHISGQKKTEKKNKVYLPHTKFCIVWGAVIYKSKSVELVKYKQKVVEGQSEFRLQHSKTKNKERIQLYQNLLEKVVSHFIRSHQNQENKFSYYLKLLILDRINLPLYHYRIYEETLNGTPYTPETEDEFTD